MRRLAALLTALFALGVLAAPARADIYIVNAADDVVDGSGCDAAHCSLREAIFASEDRPGEDSIHFNLPGEGVHVIPIATALPRLLDGVTIDGYTQPGARPNTRSYAGTDAVVLIELQGAGNDGFVLDDDTSAFERRETWIRGLALNGFDRAITYGSFDTAKNGVLVVSIEGNFIGTDASGRASRPNRVGIWVGHQTYADLMGRNVYIGGDTAARNVISGNTEHAVLFERVDTRLRLENNLIGTDADGGPLPNGGAGVRVADLLFPLAPWSWTTIGLPDGTRGNVIAFNTAGGIVVDHLTPTAIHANWIHDNGGLGIELLGEPGRDSNDPEDADAGPNGLLNHPLLTRVTGTSGAATLEGTYHGLPDRQLLLRIFWTPGSLADDDGEGAMPIAEAPIVTDASGNAVFTLRVTYPSGPGALTATATTMDDDAATPEMTSEFSPPQSGPPILTVTPANLAFGEIQVGTASEARTVTLENTGSSPATALRFVPPGQEFAADSGTCDTSLAAGASCQSTVTFTPAGTGVAEGALTVESDEGATVSLALSGTGVAPALMFEPTHLDFGNVDVGTISAAVTATLRNTGSAAATDLTFGALAHGFSADTSACGASLGSGGSCEIRVTFMPIAIGPANATLTVDSAEGATAVLALTGAGRPRYDFAEGATGFFTTTLGLFNPDREAAANVEVTLLPETGEPIVIPVTLSPFGRESLDVNAVLETPTGVAAVVRSDRPIAPLRQVSWDDRVYGSTLESGALGPSTTHYFAQGATTLWDLFYLLSNDTQTDAPVTIEYLRDIGQPVVQQVIVPARSRQTVWVNDVPGMAFTQAGAVITSQVPIAAERTMYQKGPGWAAGSSSRGTHAPDDTWYFAEGVTDAFDSYLVLMNPGRAQEAKVAVRYHFSDGQPITKTHVVPPGSRRTIRVEAEDLALINQLMAMTVSASLPIVAERATGWGPLSVLLPIPLLWYETAASVGSSDPGTVWAIGEAWTGGPLAEDAYVLLANAASKAGQVRVTLVYDDGATEAREFGVAANARTTLLLSELFPVSADRRFSVLVESLGEAPVPIVVDVSRYQSTGGRFGNAGGSTTATRIR